MSLDLLVVNPAAAHGIYGPLGDDLIAVEPPLWCRLIAGYVRDRGYSVKIIDAEAEHTQPKDVAKIAADLKPRLIAIVVFGHQPSASTQQMFGASQVLEALSEEEASWDTVIMGGHVSALPEQTLHEERVTFACKGEGPATICGLLDDAIDIADVPGLVWRDYDGEVVDDEGYKVIVNKSAALLPLEALHGNAWDLLPMPLYRSHNWQRFDDLTKRQPYASIYTSLGCMFKCSFCCINAPFGTSAYRMRNPGAVVEEIKFLHDIYGVKTFKIVDEMFILNPKHYLAICDGLIHSGIADEINIWAYARIDTVKPDTLAILRMAGIRWLALGIESGSAHVRDGADKSFGKHDIVETVRAIQAADINVIGNFMFGLPDDDLDSMQATSDLARELNCEFANFYSAMAYPGSRLYTEAVAQQATLPASWRGYSQHNDDCRPLDTKYVHGREVLAVRDGAFTAYFTDPRYLEMVGGKFGGEAVKHVETMTRYRLKRKLLEAA